MTDQMQMESDPEFLEGMAAYVLRSALRDPNLDRMAALQIIAEWNAKLIKRSEDNEHRPEDC